MSAIEVVHVTDPATVARRAADIAELAVDSAGGNPFYEPFMLEPALATVGRDLPLEFMLLSVAEPTPRLIAFLPLIRTRLHRRLPLPVLRLWEHAHCFRSTPLMRRGWARRAWAEIERWLALSPASPRILEIPRLAGHCESAQALAAHLAAGSRLKTHMSSHQSAAILGAPAGTDLDQQWLSSSLRKRLRALERKLAEIGPISVRDLAQATDVAPHIEAFLALEAGGWKGREGTALLSVPSQAAFARTMLARAHKEGRLGLHALFLGKRLAAARAEVRSGGQGFVFKIAFDEALARHSPGLYLEVAAARQAGAGAAEGQITADSCADPGDGPFYRFWPDRIDVQHWRLASGHGPGALAVGLMPAARAARERIRRLARPRPTPTEEA